MSFQSTVSLAQGFGVVGERYTDSPFRAQSYILTSADASYNVFGRGFTITSQGVAAAGGTGIFAGILIDPKIHPLQGTVSGTLASSLTLPNSAQATLCTEGTIIVTLAATAAIGDRVVFDTTTGILSTVAPGANLPVGKGDAFATIDYFTVTVAGLAVITLTPSLTALVLA